MNEDTVIGMLFDLPITREEALDSSTEHLLSLVLADLREARQGVEDGTVTANAIDRSIELLSNADDKTERFIFG